MNGSVQKKRIILTDLDGSLLHPRTYSFDEAKPALELVKNRDIPLVLVSSKTRAELEVYRDRLANRHPFVSENGGGIFVPEDYFPFPIEGDSRSGYIVVSLGTAYADIRRHFILLRDRLQIAVRGFGDMTVEEVMEVTGLARDEASLSLMREYDEPFIFCKAPDDRFLQAVASGGYNWTQGRFFHLMGNHDKGKAVNILRRYYERAYGGVTLIGLGDSLNDLPLLQAADRPVLIRRGDGTHDPRITIPGLYRTAGIGPAGWNEAVLRELS